MGNNGPGFCDTFNQGFHMIKRTVREAHIYIFAWLISVIISFLFPLGPFLCDVTNKDILTISFAAFINTFLFTCLEKYDNKDDNQTTNAILVFMNYIFVTSILITVIFFGFNMQLANQTGISTSAIVSSLFLLCFAFIHYSYQTYTSKVSDKIAPTPILGELNRNMKVGGREA